MSDLNPSSASPSPASNVPASSAAASSSSELDELKALCADLQWQTHTLRIALLIVATTVGAFLFLESHRSGKGLELLRSQVGQVAEANKQFEPSVNRFLGQLAEYAKTHQDFAAILSKYVSRSSGTSVAAPAATSTAPAAAPVAKPAAPAPAPAKK